MNSLKKWALTAVVSLLAACGGGGDSSTSSAPNSDVGAAASEVAVAPEGLDGVGAISSCGGETSPGNPYPCCGTGANTGNCTWYAWASAQRSWGINLPILSAWNGSRYSSNAKYWVDGLNRLKAASPSDALLQKLSASSTPSLGSIAVSSVGSYGHVAFVTGYNSQTGQVTVSEQNCNGNSSTPTRTRTYSAGFFDKGYIKYGSGTAVEVAPTLKLGQQTGGSVAVNATYSLTFTTADANSNLSYVDLNWNDGSAVARKFVSGASATVTFSRTFPSPRTVYWSSTAYDARGTASKMLQGNFGVVALASPVTLTSYGPSTLHAYSSSQTVYLYGSGFMSGASVVLTDPNGAAFTCCKAAYPVTLSSSAIEIHPNFAGASGTWKVKVTNSNGQSASSSFYVAP